MTACLPSSSAVCSALPCQARPEERRAPLVHADPPEGFKAVRSDLLAGDVLVAARGLGADEASRLGPAGHAALLRCLAEELLTSETVRSMGRQMRGMEPC